MRIMAHPLSAVLWDFDDVLVGPGDVPDPWMQERCAALHTRGVTQAVLTNATGPRATEIAAALEAFPGVGELFTPERTGHAKPDPQAFLAAADALALAPGAVLLVDPISAHVNAAAGAGFKTFRYSRLARDVLQRTLDAR